MKNTVLISKPPRSDTRTVDQIREHYEIERELAGRLRRASRSDRQKLYGEVYDELFRRVPHHTQITQKGDAEATRREIEWQQCLLRPWLKSSTSFLEFGAGACSLSLSLCPMVRQVLAVDVSTAIAENANTPANFKLIIQNGPHTPVDDGEVDVAYSNQLLEHLHPEDAADHFKEMYRILKPGGAYLAVTPNRVSGPWDISRYFDVVATGFHLKEYTVRELAKILKGVGFKRVICYAGARRWFVPVSLRPVQWIESALNILPFSLRAPLGRSLPARACIGIRMASVK